MMRLRMNDNRFEDGNDEDDEIEGAEEVGNGNYEDEDIDDDEEYQDLKYELAVVNGQDQ